MRSPLSTPRGFQASAFVALLGLCVAACDSGSSISPTPISPTPTAPTAPPAINLAGTWAGTASAIWDEMEGGGGCSGPVTATFAQSGSAVSATLPGVAGCISDPPLRFEGTLSGTVLRGNIVFPTFTWPTVGQASEDHLKMAALNVTWDLRR